MLLPLDPIDHLSGRGNNKLDAAGKLRMNLHAGTLAQHNRTAGKSVSGYPPLTAKESEIAALKQEIANLEKSLLALNVGIPALVAALEVAKANNDKVQPDPNATTGQKVAAVAALVAAGAAHDVAVSKRDKVNFDLRTKRERLSQLQQSPSP
jgi:hypothetical protein